MHYLISIVLFIFGLIIGSFLNVVIIRFNTGMSISRGRSQCFSCSKILRWYELIPLFSFLAQAGLCRECRSRISWQYPLVELAGGLAFVLSYTRFPGAFYSLVPFLGFILTAALLCLYIVICAYDMRHKIIPDFFSYGAALISLGLIGLDYFLIGSVDPYRVIAGPILFLFFFVFYYFSRGRWMGLGDGKLALSIGWALGLGAGVAALFISFWIGAALSLLVMALQKLSKSNSNLSMQSAIPFGPYLIIGFIIAFIWHVDIQTILAHLAL